MSYDGSEARILPGNGSQPTWSPDGTTITYTRVDSSPGEETVSRLYSVNADGSNAEQPTPIPDGTTFSESATYSPDGSELAYIGKSSAQEPWGIYVANSDGTEATRLNLRDLERVDQPEFTSDGNGLIFDAEPGPLAFNPEAENKFVPAHGNIYTVNTDGTGLHALTQGEEDLGSPVRVSSDDVLITHACVVVLNFGDGVRAETEPAQLEVIPISEAGERKPIPITESNTKAGTTGVTTGILGPHTHETVTVYCKKTKRACGEWNHINTEFAYQYARAYAHNRNDTYPFFEEEDCANYVSQLLHAGGMEFLGAYEHVKNAWWTEAATPALESIGLHTHNVDTESWSVAEALYYELLNTGLAHPLRSGETPHAGDVVFFHWFPSKGLINHVGMIVAGNSDDPETEMYTSHTGNRLWPITDEYKEIGEYLHKLDSKISPTEDERGRHWQWYILRPTHTMAYVS